MRRNKRDDSGVFKPRSTKARSRLSNRADILLDVDGRTANARRFRDLCAQVAIDQGGTQRCSEVKLQLIRRFAGLAVMAEQTEAKMVNGDDVSLADLTALASTLTRLASRIGLERKAKTITPDLKQYLAGKANGRVRVIEHEDA